MNYVNWSYDELRAECKRKGYLDQNNKYVFDTKNEESEEKIKKFMEKKNLSIDELLAIHELATKDNAFKDKLYKDIYD